MKFLATILAVIILAGSTANAQLAIDRMMKIVIRDTSPGSSDSAFVRKPKTLYRMSHTYGRIEESPGRVPGVHGLLIVAEPKIWIVNLADSTARMSIDQGPNLEFRASIARADFKNQIQPLKEFEFGTEYDFLQSRKAVAGKEKVNGKTYDKLSLDIEGYTIVLLSQKGKWQPFRVTITKGGLVDCQYDYDEYKGNLPPDMTLFEPPKWVKIVKK